MNFYFFIQYVVDAEAKLEEIRILLAKSDLFEPFTTYKRLDQPRTGGLKPENVFEFLNDNDIQVTQDQLDYIFRVLDEDSDGIITYKDFKNAILPKMNDQVKDQALNHRSYDLPVDMYLPEEIESQLSNFFSQIKQNFIQFQQIQQIIDLNKLDIYDYDNQITVDSLKIWLKQLGKDISEEVLSNFIIIIQGQQQQLQNLLDQIYTLNQDQSNEQEVVVEDNDTVEKDQEDREQIQQQQKIEQIKQSDTKTQQDVNHNQPNNEQQVKSQELNYNIRDKYYINNSSYFDIDFEIYYQQKKIIELEILLGIKRQSIYRQYETQYQEKRQSREQQIFSKVSYLSSGLSNSFYINDFRPLKVLIDQEIRKEEIRYQSLLSSINRSGLYFDGYYRYRFQQISKIYQSPIKKSNQSYLDYSGFKYNGSNGKSLQDSIRKSLNISNGKL